MNHVSDSIATDEVGTQHHPGTSELHTFLASARGECLSMGYERNCMEIHDVSTVTILLLALPLQKELQACLVFAREECLSMGYERNFIEIHDISAVTVLLALPWKGSYKYSSISLARNVCQGIFLEGVLQQELQTLTNIPRFYIPYPWGPGIPGSTGMKYNVPCFVISQLFSIDIHSISSSLHPL
ncbi:uncharacterized protein EDB91DRAFT_410293 [Suillus paluster]|uniref:uncharacterized protein n=1 Tax=Suillus paluster TaxID=48578 RepID=UPI001B87EF5F|nr:uncharacterized protein EDB91DRAFT_410293 [Suillus paluster]KAG1753654.1 hypothetical protein EDB91DRAFT_410293 [Suillus paluster]